MASGDGGREALSLGGFGSKRPRRCCAAAVLALSLWSAEASVLAVDCQKNGVDDAEEITAGLAEDCNGNDIPDACEVVPPHLGVELGGLALSATPHGMLSADWNGDGRADLLTPNRDGLGPVSLHLFLSVPGALATQERLDVAGGEPGPGRPAVATADLDADGDLDLAVAASKRLAIYTNEGDGTFSDSGGIQAENALELVVLADLSNDGVADAITAVTGERAVLWHANRGDGSFAPPVSTAVGGRPKSVKVADFDGDADVDLLVERGLLRSTLELLGNEGAGAFLPVDTLAAGTVSVFEVADLNADGRADVIATLRDRVLSWLQKPETGLGEPDVLSVSAGALALGDIDGDATLDFVLGDFDGKLVTAWLGRGDGAFVPTEPFSLVHTDLLALDADGDRDIDVAVLGSSPNRITFIVNGNSGALRFVQTEYRAGGRPHGVTTGDFTGDGLLDVVSVHCGDDNYSVFPGTGDGRLLPPRSPQVGVVVDVPACAVASADMDGDGDIDIVMRGDHMSGQGYVAVVRNDGDGVLSAPTFFDTGALSRLSVVAGDLDADGDADVATPAPPDGVVSIHFNDGMAGLGERKDVPVAGGAIDVTLGDLDANGLTDIVAAAGGAGVALLFQDGPKSFRPAVALTVADSPGSVAVADFDADGNADVASSNGGGSVAVVLNQGGGDFSGDIRFFEIPRRPNTIITSDLDADGLPDLITTNEEASSLFVLQGTGGGFFSAPETIAVGQGPRVSISRDVDADGDQDIIVANRVARSVSILLNEAPRTDSGPDYRSGICTESEFQSVSVAVGGVAGRTTRFLASFADEPDFPPTLFQNARRFPRHEEFLAMVFPERFAGLDASGFAELALRRKTRAYFAGSVVSSTGESGRRYGFDVVVDASEPSEVLALDEVRFVYERLRASFQLRPLVYAPSTPSAREAAALWEDPGFPVDLEGRVEPQPEPEPLPTPVFSVEIPAGTVVCGAFQEARAPQAEYESKSRVLLRAGVLSLPTAEATFPGNLVEELRFGPEEDIATPVGDGLFTVRVGTRASGETDFRFGYRQEFALSDGTLLEFELAEPLGFSSRGAEPIEGTLVVDDEFLTRDSGLEPFVIWSEGVARSRLGSCGQETLPLFVVLWRLMDGVVVRLEKRFDYEVVEFRTAAASLQRAEVTVPGLAPRHVEEYQNLVYSAFRHNTDRVYWVVLDPPMTLPGVEGPVHGIELQAPDGEQRRRPQARYLGAGFEPLQDVFVTLWGISRDAGAAFRRGDLDAGGSVNVADAPPLLEYLFRRGAPPVCLKSADWDDNGRVNLTDAVGILQFVFQDGAPPPPPFASCDTDPTADELLCEEFPGCP